METITDHGTGRRADGGEALLCAFERLGIDLMLSSPGSEWSALWEALARRAEEGRDAPRLLDVWHETLAVDIAMGHTLQSGQLNAVLLHSTVGVLQGSLGLMTAVQMEVPMVVASGESVSFGEDPGIAVEPQWYGYLSGSPERIAAPFVKLSRSVASAATLTGALLRAGELARSTPQGPVFLGLPVEHLHASHDLDAAGGTVPPPSPVRPGDAAIAAVAAMLAEARNPVLVVESSGRHIGAWDALIRLAEAQAMPVLMGRSATYANFPTAHPLYQGGFGDYSALADADLVLLVSPRTPWSPPHKRPAKAKIVAIGEALHKPAMNYQRLHADLHLEGDVALTLDALTAAAEKPADRDARAARWAKVHREREDRLATERDEAVRSGDLTALSIAAALREIATPDTIWIDETVTHYGTLRHHLPIGSALSFQRAPGGLGQGMGLAIGAKLARPGQPVVCLMGDGGFLYNPVVQALGAARDLDAPVLFVVFDNAGYRAMRGGVTNFHYPHGALARTGAGFGNAIAGFEYHGLAGLFGMTGLSVRELPDLLPALRAGLASCRDGRSAILHLTLEK
ncbi:thiamine pyrophosphate-dependent enzyme [Sphingomonas immobilis]|uniref:Thiamine pyrophosphate-binding protein n=1 Tax=Sphingomonas immobilis TaxID=3063997 RepID=A0ABT8ZTA2_9SPHN|nr:thiamine pyrophosphate-dependent enzyme [Sphingomonas sp. CA1-15]MDO7840792.1 thiamine pyrophosphate-binding protein [Sphingomonas sp. CA1-15]